MDNYKYIEQLLDNYWNCETSLEEEKTLRTFFLQEQHLPSHLKQYQSLFTYQEEESAIRLPDDFEAKLLKKMAATPSLRFTPFFFKIAAGLLLLLSLGIGLFTHQQHRQRKELAEARETVIEAIGMIADNLQQGETIIDDGLSQLGILFSK